MGDKVEPRVRAKVMQTATGVRLRVETGRVTFTPVAYNTFEVGSVSIELDLPSGADVGEALAEMDEVVSGHFGKAYARRLDSYLKALRYNDKKLREDREAHRG